WLSYASSLSGVQLSFDLPCHHLLYYTYMSPNLPSSLWERIGLIEEDRDKCFQAIRDRYHKYEVEELTEQGYCSFTLLVKRRKDTAFCDCGASSISLCT